MSRTSALGFVRDSPKISLVLSFIAEAASSKLLKETKVDSMPRSFRVSPMRL